MTGWVMAAVAAALGLIAYAHHTEQIKELRDELSANKAAMADQARRYELDKHRALIERDLMDGGNENLSDYMSDAAGKLWP